MEMIAFVLDLHASRINKSTAYCHVHRCCILLQGPSPAPELRIFVVEDWPLLLLVLLGSAELLLPLMLEQLLLTKARARFFSSAAKLMVAI